MSRRRQIAGNRPDSDNGVNGLCTRPSPPPPFGRLSMNLRRRMACIALIAFVRGTAAAVGGGLITLAIWWITHP